MTAFADIQLQSGPSEHVNIADIGKDCECRPMTERRLLTSDEFLACFAEPMQDMTAAPEAVADIWPYVDDLDPKSLGITWIGDVVYVYRDEMARYDHMLIQTDTANVFLVIVVDLSRKDVFGHRVLDLNSEYGIATQH